MNIKEKGCPNAVKVFGRIFRINTDFRVWLQYPDILNVDLSRVFPEGIPIITQEVVDALDGFFSPSKDIPKVESSNTNAVIDWDIDADLVYSAFMQAYHIDLMEDDLHWHKFLALFSALPEDTLLVKVMQYRAYDGNDKEMKELQRIWTLPVKVTAEEQEQIDEFNKYFG